MTFTLTDAVAVLERTPSTLDAMLRGLPAGWISATEGPDTWSPRDVVGHLIHGERTDWIPRARIILEHGEARVFDPFDRFAQFRESAGKSLEQLLDEFRDLRRLNLDALHELVPSADVLDRAGRHPDFGRVTLRELLATWVAHDLDHVVQISRTLAKQYSAAVGPWEKYLSVLKDRKA
jgi:hypothetical protein